MDSVEILRLCLCYRVYFLTVFITLLLVVCYYVTDLRSVGLIITLEEYIGIKYYCYGNQNKCNTEH